MQDSPLIIGSRTFQSRLLVGTGKYKDLNETDLAIQASGAEIVTVAIRRVNIGQHADHLFDRHVVDGEESDLEAVVLGGGVQALDQVLDLRHVGAAGDHRQGVGLAVYFQNGLFAARALLIDSGHFHADFRGASILQPDKLDIPIGTLRRFVQGGE